MLHIAILAAGQGKRMFSELPKVLHSIGGKPMLAHVIEVAQTLKPAHISVVYGHQGNLVLSTLAYLPVRWVEQAPQLGTAHALSKVLPDVLDDTRVLMLYGDCPLISAGTLRRFIKETPEDALGILSAHFNNPYGFGRVIRNPEGEVVNIVEERDASPAQKEVKEIFSGIMLGKAAFFKQGLLTLTSRNAQQELYATDLVAHAKRHGVPIVSALAAYPEEVQGVNDLIQLAALERYYQLRQAEQLMRLGVTLLDPSRFDVRGTLTVGKDVTIDTNVLILGQVTLGSNCKIGANTVLKDVSMGDGVEVLPHSMIEGANIGSACVIGPFARIRPETTLGSGVRVGNFVELKKSQLGPNTKVNHLSYLGDARLGGDVIVGAGTITCNYDGRDKHPTIIGDGAFIGSGTQLVAPVNVGEGATIAAGSTITKDAPPRQLTIARVKQISLPGWKPRYMRMLEED